jgi:hypothetical protein
MPLWKDDNADNTFDDGDTTKPGEEGFSRAKAEKQFGHKNFSYMGTPNWQPPAQPDEEAPAP